MELDEMLRVYGTGNPCVQASPSARSLKEFSKELTEDATMPRVKQTAKHARVTKAAAVTALGAAGLGLSLVGSASAIPTADIPQSGNISPNQRFVLGEEEMADVSLATFHLFDRENVGSGDLQQVAVVVRRGCGGCRACRACRACGVVRGC